LKDEGLRHIGKLSGLEALSSSNASVERAWPILQAFIVISTQRDSIASGFQAARSAMRRSTLACTGWKALRARIACRCAAAPHLSKRVFEAEIAQCGKLAIAARPDLRRCTAEVKSFEFGESDKLPSALSRAAWSQDRAFGGSAEETDAQPTALISVSRRLSFPVAGAWKDVEFAS